MIGSHNFYTRKSPFFAFSRSFTRFSYFHYFSHDTNTFRTFPEHVRSIAITFPRSPNFSEHLSNFFRIFRDFMRFFAILSDSLRVFASFTYCEYTRASPNTLFPIVADYRRVSLILLYFMSGYLVFLLGHPLCYPHTSATLPL